MADRDPDANLIVLFKMNAKENPAKSAAAGRPIFDDEESCEIRIPGNRTYVGVYPAASFSNWVVDPFTGAQRPISYAERFAKQYQQFKAGAVQTKSGTPLTVVPFLTEARRAELRALGVLTVEQLALIDGQELKNLGPGGREMKNKAQEYMADASRNAPSTVMIAELEALRAKNASLAEDLERAKKVIDADSQFDDMSDEQLRAMIASNTGKEVMGTPGRKTLLRMAAETKPSKAA